MTSDLTAILAPVNALPGVVNRQVVVRVVQNVAEQLRTRRARAHYRDEPELYAALTKEGRDTVRMRMSAMLLIAALSRRDEHGGRAMSVTKAVGEALLKYRDQDWSHKRLRALYDHWAKTQDWVSLVIRSAERGDWRDGAGAGLPDAFLEYVAAAAGEWKRADALAQAFRAVKKVWRTGRNREGGREAVPGYGFWPDWFQRTFTGAALPAEAPLPDGWSESNLRLQLKARNKWGKAVKAALHESEAKAREFALQTHGTRDGLKFLEEVTFDDVRCDFRVFDPETGEVMDLWLLVARDRATGCMLGFGMRPARAREDGSQEHLRAVDMKQLIGWLLERYGLPPYVVTWRLENGTASLEEAVVRALGHLLNHKVRFSFARMHGGTSAAGYKERAKGNSRAKAMHESFNRSQHILTSALPGQMGLSYEKRPADLRAREKETVEIWKGAQFLPESLRRNTEYPLATVQQARVALRESFVEHDARTEHAMEGFEQVLEWRRSPQHLWTLTTIDPMPHPKPADAEIRKRLESPRERMAKLIAPYQADWKEVSPDAIAAFYEHTQREFRVGDNGEAELQIDKVKHYYRPAPGMATPVAGERFLGYFHPDFPDFLHVSTLKGSFVGTWLKVQLVKTGDTDALTAAIAASEAAVSEVRERARVLGTGERERLEAMRAHNAELGRYADAIEVTETGLTEARGMVEGGITAQLAAARKTLAGARKAQKRVKDDEEDLAALADAAAAAHR